MDEKGNSILRYNALVIGWHGYYHFATHVSRDFSEIAFLVKSAAKGKLEQQMKREISKPIISPVYIKYSKSKEIRFIGETPILPIAYVRHKNPIDKKRIINSYTPQGRAEIHKRLSNINVGMLHYLMRNPVRDMSIKYNDNRLSLYCSQQGKCAVTGKILEIGRMHCHHKTAKHLGGNDSYANLTLIDVNVHTLIHATKEETVKKLLVTLQLDKKQLEKVNKLRNLLHLNEILQ